MPFTIYNTTTAGGNAAPFSDAQARPDKIDIDVLAAGFNGNAVTTTPSCLVTAQGSPNTTVAVAAGQVMINNALVSVTAVPALSVPSLPPANNRKDLVVVNTSGVVSVVTGSVVAAVPDMPNVPANSLVLACLDVGPSTTTIATANISDKRVIAPVNQTQILGSLALNTTVVHQGKAVLLLSGTFTAWAPIMVFRMDVGAQVNGGGFGGLAFFVANNGALPNTPLYSSNWAYVAGNARFAASVNLGDAHAVGAGIGLQYEQQSAMSTPLRVTGLTPGNVYTWQVVGACSGFSAFTACGRSPLALAVSPNNRTCWVANNSDNSVSPVQIGARPQWGLGLTPYSTVSGAPIPTGAAPIALACTPDGKYVVVANQTGKTATVINAQTRQVVGTSAAVSTGNLAAVTITQDGTTAWISDVIGNVRPMTIATQVLSAAILVGAVTDNMAGLAMSGDGKTLWVNDFTTSRIYPLTLTSNTTATIGASLVSPAAVGQPYGIGCCTTAATVAAGVNCAGATIAATVITGFNNFPTNPGVGGQTIRIPTAAGPPVVYTTVNYTSCSTSGNTITFAGCTGGVGTSVAGTLVIDESAFVGGTAGGITQARTPGIVQTSVNLSAGGLTSVAVLADGQEVWACSNTTPGKFVQIDASNMAINTPAQASSDQLWSVALTTDGYIMFGLVNSAQVYNIWAGTFTINPANPLPSGVQYLSLSAAGAA